MKTPIPVRIPLDWLPRIDAAARILGTNRARLIAFCAQTFCESLERRGVAMMPPNWEAIFSEMDGRRTRYPPSPAYTLNEKALKEAEISGTAQLGAKAALAALGLSPKAVSTTYKNAARARRAHRAKGGRPLPRVAVPN